MAEHAAQGTTIHDAGMNTKANDPPGVLVHDHQHPMAAQDRRLAAEQVHAPQAVLRLPQERQPGGTAPAGTRSIVRGEHSADHVLVDLDVEGQTDLLGDPRTAPPGITPLHRHHGIHEDFGWPFGAGATAPGCKQPAVLARAQRPMESQNRRWSQDDRRAEHAGRAHKERTHPGQDPIRCAEVRRPLTRAIENQQLLLDQKRFGDDRPQTAGAQQPRKGGDQMNEQDEQVAHRHILATCPGIAKLDTLTGLRG